MKDRNVDRMLKSRGYSTAKATVYYSSVNYSLLFVLLVFVALLPFSAQVIRFWQYLWVPLLIFLLASYINSAALNNSFAFTQDELIVVNPNFPFRRFESHQLNRIKTLRIDQSKLLFAVIPFGLGVNYVEINGKKHHCAHLDRDSFDENWTELTIDDLHAALKARNIPVDFRLN